MHKHVHTYVLMYPHVHTDSYTNSNTCSWLIDICTLTYKYMHVHTNKPVHPYTYTLTNKYTHMHTCSYIHIFESKTSFGQKAVLGLLYFGVRMQRLL